MWTRLHQSHDHLWPLVSLVIGITLIQDLPAGSALSEIESIQNYLELLNVSRNYDVNRDNTEEIRNFIDKTLQEEGYGTWRESFKAEGETGYNIIGKLDGLYEDTEKDQILVIGAHYDTYQTSPGFDDNGSGLAALLQVARQFNDIDQDCAQNFSIMFVAFDMKECKTCNEYDPYKCICSYGSKHFIRNLTQHLGRQNSGKVQGAIIMDSIMNFNQSLNSQNFSEELRNDVDQSITSTVEDIDKDGKRGNFLMAVGRMDGDQYLLGNFSKYYTKSDHYKDAFKLKLFKWTLQQRPSTLGPVAQNNYRHLFVGDHYRFWDNDPIVNAIYLTDTADFRGYMKHCYHNECDVMSHLTTERLQFVANTADTIDRTARELTMLDINECSATKLGNISEAYSSDSGSFESPDYPRRYPNNADCMWNITVTADWVVELWFDDFRLEDNECRSDFVEVWNGFEKNSRLLGRFCGNKKPKPSIKSTGRNMKVVFQSDRYDTYPGFRAKWKASKGASLTASLLGYLCVATLSFWMWSS